MILTVYIYLQTLIDKECKSIDLPGKYGLIRAIVIPAQDLQIYFYLII